MKNIKLTLCAVLITGFTTLSEAQDPTEGCTFNPTQGNSLAQCVGQDIKPFYVYSIHAKQVSEESSPEHLVPTLFVTQDMYTKPNTQIMKNNPILQSLATGLGTTWDDLRAYNFVSSLDCNNNPVKVISAEIVYDQSVYQLDQDYGNNSKVPPYRIQNMEFKCVE